jgi:hypothetical protein
VDRECWIDSSVRKVAGLEIIRESEAKEVIVGFIDMAVIPVYYS